MTAAPTAKRNPVITVPVDEVLEALDHGDNWIQGRWTDGNGRMCLHQGIRVCHPMPGDAYLIEAVAMQQGWGPTFNDNPDTTFDALKQRLVEHREVFPDELEAAFGPQWALIVRLVRTAATLTTEQAHLVAAARNAARYAARYAAWNAAQAAARNAAQDAARAAALDAAWAAAQAAARAAAWEAAWDAAGALTMRDLIGQHGFTQAHYDTLTAPWRTVFPNFETPGVEAA
ncbi:MAG: hypothetical protein AAF467_27765 [Actinomycetota bacterium]